MTEQQDTASIFAQNDLFEGGPPRRLTALVRLPAPICPNVPSRVGLVIILGWVPLLVLTLFAPPSDPEEALRSFSRDVGLHARYLIAAPLLVIGWKLCARRLGSVALHFVVSGLLDADGERQFEDILVRARRQVSSLWAEAIMLALIYGVILALIGMPVAPGVPTWSLSGDTLSAAGWWRMLVSAPLLFLLVLGWIWRVMIWTDMLRRISRLELRLIAAHPDQSAGLGFLCQSVRAFALVGAALGTIAAGRFANVHLAGQATPFTDGLLVGGIALISVALFVGPLTVFVDKLTRVWRIGAMTYGALGTELGLQFERSWFAGTRPAKRQMLSEPDFSAATDLYQVVANVYAMRFVPVDFNSLAILLVATLAPFVPAMFLSMPTTVAIAELRGLFF